ncbi:hypothetical protein T440DRAFT_479717 [Plenodomus tracheiphilus IPT5]|uniref:Uncharacterized protein n=1 Tax=Plenodomus tracheiphilus IPT5 TaxID=1408161 RepID=A0A6A7B667_9PLEO|nr:hypothetical protein T440DRAFT_479717 [Plenodomus tracheiphilus IPT5]
MRIPTTTLILLLSSLLPLTTAKQTVSPDRFICCRTHDPTKKGPSSCFEITSEPTEYHGWTCIQSSVPPHNIKSKVLHLHKETQPFSLKIFPRGDVMSFNTLTPTNPRPGKRVSLMHCTYQPQTWGNISSFS